MPDQIQIKKSLLKYDKLTLSRILKIFMEIAWKSLFSFSDNFNVA